MAKYLFVIVTSFFALLLVIFQSIGPREVVYDCNMAEWHPDIPKAVRDECRRLRYEQWKEENERKTNKGLHESGRNVLRT